MPPLLFSHPFSSYCQKVLAALYETGAVFETRMLASDHPEHGAELMRRWPVGRFPILVDGDVTLMEATVIVEHFDVAHPAPRRMVPADPAAALPVRMMDRIFDNYVMTPMQKIVFDAIRPAASRDAFGVAEARAMLDRAYGWLDERLVGATWAAGAEFTLADCAAAPALFFADWVHPIPAERVVLRDYRARLLARPSVARAVDEARPFRRFFPLGDPGRD